MPLLAGLTVIRTVIGSMPFDKVPPCVQFFGFVSASIPPLMCFCARPVIDLLAGPPAGRFLNVKVQFISAHLITLRLLLCPLL